MPEHKDIISAIKKLSDASITVTDGNVAIYYMEGHCIMCDIKTDLGMCEECQVIARS